MIGKRVETSDALFVLVMAAGSVTCGYFWWKYRQVPAAERRRMFSDVDQWSAYQRHPWALLVLSLMFAVAAVVLLFTTRR